MVLSYYYMWRHRLYMTWRPRWARICIGPLLLFATVHVYYNFFSLIKSTSAWWIWQDESVWPHLDVGKYVPRHLRSIINVSFVNIISGGIHTGSACLCSKRMEVMRNCAVIGCDKLPLRREIKEISSAAMWKTSCLGVIFQWKSLENVKREK